MKNASPALLDLLSTGEYVSAECWTITLIGGEVIRWTGADISVTFDGNTFQRLAGTDGTPGIKRGSISEKVGVEVATLKVYIYARPEDTINGAPVIPFIANHGFDGATVQLERAFAPDWASPMVGSIIRFSGKVTSVDSIQGANVELTVSSWLVLLNINMPRNYYQAACIHTLFDPGCTLNAAAFATNGAVVGSSGATLTFGTNLVAASGYYSLGRIVFTSGLNIGISRSIRSADGSGNLTLITPLPNPLAPGDTFTAYPGCDLTTGAGGCAKFSNILNFKGTPFVPKPQTPLGSQSTTTTTSSGKG